MHPAGHIDHAVVAEMVQVVQQVQNFCPRLCRLLRSPSVPALLGKEGNHSAVDRFSLDTFGLALSCLREGCQRNAKYPNPITK